MILDRFFTVILLGIVFLISGCNLPQFEPAHLVKDRRILAVRAEPPEVHLNIKLNQGKLDLSSINLDKIEMPSLSLLLVEPAGAIGPVAWSAVACPTNREFRCDGEATKMELGQGEDKPEDIRIKLKVNQSLLMACAKADPLAVLSGIAVQVSIKIGEGEEALYASKDVVFGYPFPAGRTPNTNPDSTKLQVDQQEWKSNMKPVIEPGQKMKIDPMPRENSQEAYQLATFSGSTEKFQERFKYIFYATAGKFSPAKTGGRDFLEEDTQDPFHTFFAIPKEYKESGPIRFWMIIDDQRGGINWLEREIEVKPR